MEPIAGFILSNIAQSLISELIGNINDSALEKFKTISAQTAYKQAIGRAIERYAESGKFELTRSLLREDGFLTIPTVSKEIAKILQFTTEPNCELIGKHWQESMDTISTWYNFTEEAKVLINYMVLELKTSEVFHATFEMKNLDYINKNSEESTKILSEIEKKLQDNISLINSQFGQLIQLIIKTPVNIKDKIRDFSSYILQKTKDFTGREFIFDEIDNFIQDNERGYFFILGDPGIGKSSISAKLVKDRGYIHHFNIRAQAINKGSDFLKNVCAQLIAAYSLNYDEFPEGAFQDSGFINKLLEEISKKLHPNEKCVIVIDALDEAEDLKPISGANILFLPPTLPLHIFIIATSRRNVTQLRIDIREQRTREILQDDRLNISDTQKYIELLTASRDGIKKYIQKNQLKAETFTNQLVGKAQGNFIYLYHVLQEIENGAYANSDIENIPIGLENYYQDHWRRMSLQNELDWFQFKLPIIMALTVAKEPISIEDLSRYAEIDQTPQFRPRVFAVLRDFDQFIYHCEVNSPNKSTTLYRWYHNSFFDFISKKDEIEDGVSFMRAKIKTRDQMWKELQGEL